MPFIALLDFHLASQQFPLKKGFLHGQKKETLYGNQPVVKHPIPDIDHATMVTLALSIASDGEGAPAKRGAGEALLPAIDH